MRMKFAIITILFLIMFSLNVLAFLINDGFTYGLNPLAYTNDSQSGTINITFANQSMYIAGNTSLGVTSPAYIKSINSLGTGDNGTFIVQLTPIFCMGGGGTLTNIRLAATEGTAFGNGIQLGQEDQSCNWIAENQTHRLCVGTALQNSGTHIIQIDALRVGTRTNYTMYVDGAYFCAQSQEGQSELRAIISDPSISQSYHKNKFDNFYWTDYNYTRECPEHQSPPMVTEDNFDYFIYIDSCGWYPEPIHNILPSMGQLCFSGATLPQDFRYYLPIQGNLFGANIFTEEFDLTLDNNSGFEKDFKFRGDKLVYVFNWFSIGNDTYIQYSQMINGTSSISSLCSNCWNQNTKDHYKITLYGGRGGETIFNLSQNSFQNVNTETVSIQVNNDQIYFNIPTIQTSDDRIPEDMDLFIAGGEFCLDNYKLYSGKISYRQEISNITGIPTKNTGEHCNTDWECYSGLCNYLHICDLKGYLAVCLNDIECMSKNCNDGYCTKPTFWESVDTAKSDLVGDDEKTNNLLSLIISLGIGTALTIWGAIAGAGIVSGALGMAAFTTACFFFTIVGWLSPFILIGVIIVVVLLIILIVTLR